MNASAEFLGLGETLAGSLFGGLMGEIIGYARCSSSAPLARLLFTLWLVLSRRTLPTAPSLGNR
jgi:hypothetical protein